MTKKQRMGGLSLADFGTTRSKTAAEPDEPPVEFQAEAAAQTATTPSPAPAHRQRTRPKATQQPAQRTVQKTAQASSAKTNTRDRKARPQAQPQPEPTTTPTTTKSPSTKSPRQRQRKTTDKPMPVNIKIPKSQQDWLRDTAQQVRDNNTMPVPARQRVFPQHLISVAIDLLKTADVDWSEIRNVEELKDSLNL